MTPLDEEYFAWLYSHIGSWENKNLNKTYVKLCKLLHSREFVWVIERDQNRAEDGKQLRRDFISETNFPFSKSWMNEKPCTFFELLVSLSTKMEFDGGRSQPEWFVEILKNLELEEFTDAKPPRPGVVDPILRRVITRKYDFNGYGGLFPLSNPVRDQRDVELIYQAEAYLLEHI